VKDATEVWLVIIAAIGAFLTAVWKTWTNLRRLSRMVDEFLGYEEHPGAVERIANLEDRIAELERLMSIHLVTVHGVDPDDPHPAHAI